MRYQPYFVVVWNSEAPFIYFRLFQTQFNLFHLIDGPESHKVKGKSTWVCLRFEPGVDDDWFPQIVVGDCSASMGEVEQIDKGDEVWVRLKEKECPWEEKKWVVHKDRPTFKGHPLESFTQIGLLSAKESVVKAIEELIAESAQAI